MPSNVASLPLKRRLNNNEMDSLVQSYCQDYTTLDELARKIDRDKRYVKNHVVPRMVKEGKLEMLYPTVPKHPSQSYKTTKRQ